MHFAWLGYRARGDAREGVGVLQLCSGGRDHEQGEPQRVPQVSRLVHVGDDLGLTVCYRIWWRPRILRDVTNVDFATKILGYDTKLPLYIVSGSDVAYAHRN